MLYMHDDEWVVEPGSFSLMIGSSSQDIRLQHKIYVTQKVLFEIGNINKNISTFSSYRGGKSRMFLSYK